MSKRTKNNPRDFHKILEIFIKPKAGMDNPQFCKTEPHGPLENKNFETNYHKSLFSNDSD